MSSAHKHKIEPLYAQVVQAPTDPAPAGSHRYIVDVQTPDGRISSMEIGHSATNFWPLPLHVRPLPVGRLIHGLRVANIAQWHYTEIADFGPCNGTGARAGSGLMQMLQAATRDELLFLKGLLEGVK